MQIGGEPDDENVTKLPVRFKHPLPEQRVLIRPHEVPRPGDCMHFMVTYIVDDKAAEVECGECGAKLNPMWVLGQLASEDRRMNETAKRYKEEMRRLAERKRTKCRYCGKMTTISRK